MVVYVSAFLFFCCYAGFVFCVFFGFVLCFVFVFFLFRFQSMKKCFPCNSSVFLSSVG